jgi:hypothetical protein
MLKTPLTLLIDFVKSNKDIDIDALLVIATEIRDSAEKHELIRARMGDFNPGIESEDFGKLYQECLNWYNSRYIHVSKEEESGQITTAQQD